MTERLWRKSRFSGQNGSCVEIAGTTGTTAVRNSNHPDAGTLAFPSGTMRAFVDACAAGEFDDLAD